MADVLARWDALVLRWGLDGPERSMLLGPGMDGPVDEVESYLVSGAERRMRLLVELDGVLAVVFEGEDRTRSWLRRDNANLGNRTPVEVMAASPEWIRWLVNAMGAST
ncbi:MAG: DUF2384 domain-containing protein [Sphingomonadales bacterium]|nr:DUF2384 domain-containing protein [Sphingomonadales bacterium]MDE2171911.1 DUF2384 domain-containing protein [Sphingomonadales bacterium]